MWWGVLPSFAIVGICIAGIPLSIYAYNRFFLNTPYLRRIYTLENAHYYLRDARISGVGNPYKQVGLENISLGSGKGL